jgi:hypothetical protein
MNEIRKNWLMDGWEGHIEQSILVSSQGDTPFWDWLQSLQVTAALIVGTYAELDDNTLCTHIKSHMNESLKLEASHKTHKEPDFKLWTAVLKSLDDEHVNNECRLCEMIAKDRLTRLEFSQNHTLANPSHNANVNRTTTNNNNSTNATASFFTTARLPALTTNECT